MNSNSYKFVSSKGTSVICLRGSNAPKQTGGGGGWEVEARPRRVGLTLWKGREPYRMDVPVLFDGWAADRSIEVAISTLNQMQMGKDLQEPASVTIEGLVPVKGIKWVIESIEWGDEVIWGDPGRLRQDAVVRLLQYNPEVMFQITKTSTPKPKTVKTKAGDTLRKVAARPDVYRDESKWQIIAKAQKPPLRKMGSEKLAAGIELRIP